MIKYILKSILFNIEDLFVADQDLLEILTNFTFDYYVQLWKKFRKDMEEYYQDIKELSYYWM